MSLNLTIALKQLRNDLLDLGEAVERNVAFAICTIDERDPRPGMEAIFTDTEIDRRVIQIEEQCLQILTLYHPVASEMRFVASLLKINRDLERIGDLSVNLAEQAMRLIKSPVLEPTLDAIKRECRCVAEMIHLGMRALICGSADLARDVLKAEPEVNSLHRGMYFQVSDAIRAAPEEVDHQIAILQASRQVERMADHMVIIARDVIFMVEGEIVRLPHLSTGAT